MNVNPKIKEEPRDSSEISIHNIPTAVTIKRDPDRPETKVFVENCQCCGTHIPPVQSSSILTVKSEFSSLKDVKEAIEARCAEKVNAESQINPSTARIKITAPSPPPLPPFEKSNSYIKTKYYHIKPWHKWRRPKKNNNTHRRSHFHYHNKFSRDFDSSRKYNLNRYRLYNLPLKPEKKEVILLKITSTDNTRPNLISPYIHSSSSDDRLTTNNELLIASNNTDLSEKNVTSPVPSMSGTDKGSVNMEIESGIGFDREVIMNLNKENFLVVDEVLGVDYKEKCDSEAINERDANEPYEREDAMSANSTNEGEFVVDNKICQCIGQNTNDNCMVHSSLSTSVIMKVSEERNIIHNKNDSSESLNQELEIVNETPNDEEIICIDHKTREIHLCTNCFVKGRKEKKENDVIYIGQHNKKLAHNRAVPIISIVEVDEVL